MTGILSHNPDAASLDDAVAAIRQRLGKSTELLALLDDLTHFEFGRFLILNSGGWDGYWTWKVINRPGSGEPFVSDLERFIFLEAPTVLATRERFHLFRAVIEAELEPGMELASLPCGVMADLLTLKANGARFCGLDLDENSLRLAAELASEHGLDSRCEFIQADAWNLEIADRFDILTSNGLNIYEPDDNRVTALYRSFAQALKPGGLLVTSFLTPPPHLVGPEGCEWDFAEINPQALELQRQVFAEILDASWACYRSSAMTRQQLQAAGFERIELIPGATGVFPTAIARAAA